MRPKKKIVDVSQFTEILSRVADDPSLKEKPVIPAVVEKKVEKAAQQIDKKEDPDNAVEKGIETNQVKLRNLI